jgi:uncharacterized membrane protein
MSDIDYDRLSEAVARAIVAGGSGNAIDPRNTVGSRNAHADEKEWARMMATIKKAHTGFDKWNNVLKKGQLQYVDVTERLKELDDEIANIDENLSTFEATIATGALEEKKAALIKAAAAQNFSSGLSNAISLIHKGADGVGRLGMSAASSAGTLTKSFLDSGSGIGLATEAMTAGIDLAGQASGAAGQAIGGVGNAMTRSSNKWVKGLGMATEALGPFVGMLGEGASKLLKFGVAILGKEVEKTVKAFNDASSVGAMFGGGLSELRDTALNAGLTMDQFANVLQKHSADLAGSGMGVAEGSRRMGAAIKAGGTEMKTQLLNLGYSFEEQAGLVAETMKDMRGSGGPLRASNAQVAIETQKYAENLRTIAAITGEDGKKRMEEARNKANQLAFQQKLAGMDEKQRRGVVNAMGNMSEIQQKNFMDMVNFGSVINQEGATAAALSPGLNDSVQQFTDSFKNGTLDEMEARRIQANNTDQIKKDMLDNVAIGLAGAAGVGGLVQSLSESMGTELQFRNKWTEEAIKAGTEGVQAQKTTQDEFTGTVRDVEIQMQSFKVQLQTLINPLLGEYTRVLDESIQAMQKLIDEAIPDHKKMGSESGSWWSKNGRAALDYGGTALGTAGGALAGGLSSFGVAAIPGAVMGGLGGHEIGNSVADALGLPPADKGKADGGIASGSKRGFLEKLHGTELVIPLDSGGKLKAGTQGYADLMTALPSAEPQMASMPNFENKNSTSISNNIQPPSADFSGIVGSIQEMSEKFSIATTSSLDSAIAALTNKLSSKESAESINFQIKSNSDLTEALQNLITTARDQLEKQDEMLRAMNDTKDYTERLYNAMA